MSKFAAKETCDVAGIALAAAAAAALPSSTSTAATAAAAGAARPTATLCLGDIGTCRALSPRRRLSELQVSHPRRNAVLRMALDQHAHDPLVVVHRGRPVHVCEGTDVLHVRLARLWHLVEQHVGEVCLRHASFPLRDPLERRQHLLHPEVPHLGGLFRLELVRPQLLLELLDVRGAQLHGILVEVLAQQVPIMLLTKLILNHHTERTTLLGRP